MSPRSDRSKAKKRTSRSKDSAQKEVQNQLDALARLIHNAKRVLISTHVQPDGDGLGAQTALFHYLKRARKACRIYNPDPLPKRYSFLDPKEKILLGPGEVQIWDRFDLWLILDTNDPKRLSGLWSELKMRASQIVFLDHHPAIVDASGNPPEYPSNSQVVTDVNSSSIGELLYRLFKNLELCKLNLDMAVGLYVSIMTDTNSFRYARTTSLSHEIAAEMIQLGVNPEEVYQNIYSSKELIHLHLLGRLLTDTQVTHNGRLAWMKMDHHTLKEYRASADDTQSFMNLLLLLKDAQVVCLFRQEDENNVRVSIRSKGKVVVNKLAMELGGGGHRFAAGLRFQGNLDQAVEVVTQRLTEIIEHFELFNKSN